MTISRIATFAQANQVLTASLRTQAQMADLQTQESSTVKSTTFGGLAGDAGQLLDLQGQSARLTADTAAAKQAQSLAQAAYSALGNVSSLATTIKSALASMVSGANTDSSLVAGYASQWLDDLTSILNTKVGGTALFAGTATDQDAVDLTGYVADPASTATGYYAGSAAPLSQRFADGGQTQVSVTASAPALEELVRALSLIKASPGDAATLNSAYDLVGQAVTGVGDLQETVSGQANSLQDRIDRNGAKVDALQTMTTALNGVDLAQATVLVTQYQTQLETLYSTISKLSDLSLAKYL